MTGQPMLKVDRLTKTYATAAGPLTVLREVSFELAAGATLSIVGPSGSGKTTLLGLCAGLDRATSGEVTLAGHALGPLDEDGRARVRNANVGFVFQNFQLIPTLTALENVLVPIELGGRGQRGNRRPGRSWNGWGWAAAATTIRCSFPAASSSGRRWRGRLRTGQGYSFATNPRGISTATRRRRWSN